MMAVRCLLGGAILLAIGSCRERDWHGRRGASGAAPLVVGSLLFVGCHGVLAYVEKRVPSGIAALCLATIPLFVPLLAVVRAGRAPAVAAAGGGAVVGFAGVALLVASQGAGGGLSPGDALLLVGSALSWAAGTVATRARADAPLAACCGAALPLLAGGVVLTLIAAARASSPRPSSPTSRPGRWAGSSTSSSSERS